MLSQAQTRTQATASAHPGLVADGATAAVQRIEARHGHSIGALAEALAEHRLAWHAAREDGDFARILQAELRYAEAAAAIADALRARGEPDDAVDAYLKAKRREIDAWAPYALPSLRRWGVFAKGRSAPRQ
jgi:hypothetical protein